MNAITAIILGLVQGLTEFIPVSSSGHILLAAKLLNIPANFKFDVLLNIGTLTALVLFYRQTIWEILVDIFKNKNFRLALRVIVATIPAALIGAVFSSFIEKRLQSSWVVVAMLLIIGLLMVANRKKSAGSDASKLSIPAVVRIGLAQALALVPGSSRSGLTILEGEREGLSAAEAARFSFMMAIPIILGATAKVALGHEGRAFLQDNLGLVVLGNIVSFVSGAIAIRFLIRIISEKGLRPFGYYRIGLAVLLIVLLFARIV